MEKSKSYRIVIKASGLYPAAEKAKSLVAENGGKFKTIVTSTGSSLNFFIDEAIPANQYGTQFRCTDESGNDARHDEALHTAVKKGEATVSLEGFDEASRIIGTITIPVEIRITDAASSNISAAVQSAIDAKVAEGAVTAECARERVEYMIRNYFFEEDILEVIDHWHSVEGACGHKALYVDPKLEEHHKAGLNGTVLRGVRNVLCGNPVLLKGPKATGKNTFVTTIAWLLGELLRYHTAGLGETKDDYVSTQVTDNEAADKVAKMSAEDIVNCEIIRAKSAVSYELSLKGKEDFDEIYYTQASAFYDACQAAVTGSAGRMTISDDCLNVRGLVRALTSMGIYGDRRTTLRQEITDHVITPCDNEERMSLNETLRKYVSK